MNGRELWFSILQAAVVAPWLWQQAGKSDNQYFSIGLRLVGTAIFVSNIPPILAGARDIAAQYSDAKKSQTTADVLTTPYQAFRDPNTPMTAGNEILDAASMVPHITS